MQSSSPAEPIFQFKPSLHTLKTDHDIHVSEFFSTILQALETIYPQFIDKQKIPNSQRESLGKQIKALEILSDLPIYHFICEHALTIQTPQIRFLKFLHEFTGIAFSVRDKQGNHLLHVAALHNYLELTKFLILEMEQSIDVVNNKQIHPLSFACMKGYHSKQACDPKNNIVDFYIDYLPKLSSEKNTALIIASREGRPLIIDWLLKFRTHHSVSTNDPRHVDYQNTNGTTAITAALTFEHFNIFQKLENFGGEPLIKDNYGANALHYLASFIDMATFIDFMEKYEISLDPYMTEDDTCILNYAVLNPDTDLLKLLIISSNISPTQIQNLISTIEFNDKTLATLRYLVTEHDLKLWHINESGCRDYVVDERGQNALHLAILSGAVETCHYLVNELSFDIESRDLSGASPLFTAASQEILPHSQAIMEWLIDECGAKTNITEQHGLPLSHMLAHAKHNNVLLHLLNEGKIDILTLDSQGLSIYDVAIIKQNITLIESLTQYIKRYNLTHPPIQIKNYRCFPKFLCQLIDIKALNFTNIDDEGDYPLHTLAKYADSHLLLNFLESHRDFDINQQNKQGETALKMILARLDDDLARQFISRFKPDITSLDKHGKNIYSELCQNNRVDLLAFVTKSSLHQKPFFDALCFQETRLAFQNQKMAVFHFLINYQIKYLKKSQHPLFLAIAAEDLAMVKVLILEQKIPLNLKPQKNSSLLKLASSNKSNGIFNFLMCEMLATETMREWLCQGMEQKHLGITKDDLLVNFIQEPNLNLYNILQHYYHLHWNHLIFGKIRVIDIIISQEKIDILAYICQKEMLKMHEFIDANHLSDEGILKLKHITTLWPNRLDPMLETFQQIAADSDLCNRIFILVAKAPQEIMQRILASNGFWQLQNIAQQNLLHICAIHNRLDLISMVLAHQSASLNTKDIFGRTPLHHAAAFGHHEMVQVLLSHPDIDLLSSDNQGQNLLHQAIQNICSPLALTIIRQYPHLLFVKDCFGKMPWQFLKENASILVENEDAKILSQNIDSTLLAHGFFKQEEMGEMPSFTKTAGI